MSSIVFIGGGNMASCIIGGMVAEGFEPTDILVSVPTQVSRERLKADFGVLVTDNNRRAVADACWCVPVCFFPCLPTSRG